MKLDLNQKNLIEHLYHKMNFNISIKTSNNTECTDYHIYQRPKMIVWKTDENYKSLWRLKLVVNTHLNLLIVSLK